MGPDRESGAEPRTFACVAPATVERVWRALVDCRQTPFYLHGLAAYSTWVANAPIDFRFDGRSRLTGRVLCVRSADRLSVMVQSGPNDPPTFLTWLLRSCEAGTVIRLQVDELDDADSREDSEDRWLPVLARLQQLLASD